jgi:protease-4
MDDTTPSSPPLISQPPPASTPPPGLTPPPPVLTAPGSTNPRRGGRGWMVFALILLFLLGLSMLSNLGHFARSVVGVSTSRSRSVGPRLEEVITEDNSANDKIAVVDIAGIITSRVSDQGGYNMVDIIKAQLKHAEEDNHVKAVLLKVDSPGGEVLASDEIYRALSDFQKKARKPIVASMGNLAASGGYYVSAPCRWIVANDLTITGSIGVIMHSYNYRGLMNKVGLRPETYKSGKFKDMLSGDRDLEEVPAEEREMVQNLINETYGKFKSVVAEGRKLAAEQNKGEGRKLSDSWTDYADGRVLSGTEAYKLGFVDQLGNFQDAVDRAKLIAGIRSATLIEYQQHYDLSDIFRLFGKSDARTMKIDLGIEAPKLQVGQLYFLSPTFAH